MNDPYRRTQMTLARQQGTREVERDIFMRITRRLEVAAAGGNRRELVAAACDCRRLWMVLVTDVLTEGNALPADLRQRIVEVGRAVINEITDNLDKEIDVAFVVEVNRAVIDGLVGKGTP